MIWTLENDMVDLGGTTHFPIPTYDAPFFVVAHQSSEDGFGLICTSCNFCSHSCNYFLAPHHHFVLFGLLHSITI